MKLIITLLMLALTGWVIVRTKRRIEKVDAQMRKEATIHAASGRRFLRRMKKQERIWRRMDAGRLS